MLIAKVTDTNIDVADHAVFLPNTSFGAGGPTVAQIEELGFLQVTVWKPYDHATEKLVSCEAYVEDKQVFTIKVESKTKEEVELDIAAAEAAQKAARSLAYREEADPLFFKAQRGEATMDEWLAKVKEIKQRF